MQPAENRGPSQPAPSWPMQSRRAEQLLGVVWALQQKNGWCYASQPYLGECIGVSDRQVRNLINACHRAGHLQIKSRHGQTVLMRAIPPRLGQNQPRKKASDLPRKNTSGDPGNSFPTMLNQYSPKEIVGNPDAAPLFVPKAVNLWEAAQRLGGSTLCQALSESFKRAEIGKVRFRGIMRSIAKVTLLGPSYAQVLMPTGRGGDDCAAWHDEDLTRLEFYP